MAKIDNTDVLEQAAEAALESFERNKNETPVVEVELSTVGEELQDAAIESLDFDALEGEADVGDAATHKAAEEPEGAVVAMAAFEELEAEAVDLREKADNGKVQLLRMAADFENFRKRTVREREDARKFGHEPVLLSMLPIVDNLERALSSAEEETGAVVDGVKMIHRQVLEVLSGHGVKPFDSVGQGFDPNLHEALSQVPSEDAEPGTVLHEMERGFNFYERLLRPAKVVVVAAPTSTPTTPTKD